MFEFENNDNTDPNQQNNNAGAPPIKDESELSGWEEAAHDVPELPKINLERDFLIAKSYLQKIGYRNETVWDHLNDILHHVLKERPKDCMRYFEELSRDIRIKKFFLTNSSEDMYKDLSDVPKDTDDYKLILRFYRRVECLYQIEPIYDDKFGNLDFIPFFRLLNEAAVGFPYSDMYNIQMGLRFIAKSYPVSKIQLWGRIYGTIRDYIIVEAELTPEAMGERFKDFMSKAVVAMQEPVDEEQETLQDNDPEEFFKDEFVEEASLIAVESKRKLDTYMSPAIPIPVYTKEVVIPVEPPGHGPNRKVYLVTNDPTDEWILLPDVTPQQIVSARTIKKYFTGILSNVVHTYPEFPGTEMELLRTQIARITASTHVSPLGFYSSGGEEEAVVEVEEGQLYTENADYQPLPTRDLLDPTLEFWVHHEPYILKQGRTEFWTADVPAEEDLEEEGGISLTRERGPPILTTLSQDTMRPDNTPAWNVRRASTLLDEDSAVVIRSNIWPGALTAVKDRLFANFYVGWANKCDLKGFSPIIVSNVKSEYELGPEIMEMQDPTVEMEEFRWLQLHPKITPHLGGEEGGGEEEEETEVGDT